MDKKFMYFCTVFGFAGVIFACTAFYATFYNHPYGSPSPYRSISSIEKSDFRTSMMPKMGRDY